MAGPPFYVGDARAYPHGDATGTRSLVAAVGSGRVKMFPSAAGRPAG